MYLPKPVSAKLCGLEPTKTYRVAVKGTFAGNTLPNFKYSLKAKARTTPGTNNYNVLSTWMKDNGGSLQRNEYPNQLKPYYYGTDVHRATTRSSLNL